MKPPEQAQKTETVSLSQDKSSIWFLKLKLDLEIGALCFHNTNILSTRILESAVV